MKPVNTTWVRREFRVAMRDEWIVHMRDVDRHVGYPWDARWAPQDNIRMEYP